MTPDQRDEAITVLQSIFHRESHDLESLAPRFMAERMVELLEQAGYAVIKTQGLSAAVHVDPDSVRR